MSSIEEYLKNRTEDNLSFEQRLARVEARLSVVEEDAEAIAEGVEELAGMVAGGE